MRIFYTHPYEGSGNPIKLLINDRLIFFIGRKKFTPADYTRDRFEMDRTGLPSSASMRYFGKRAFRTCGPPGSIRSFQCTAKLGPLFRSNPEGNDYVISIRKGVLDRTDVTDACKTFFFSHHRYRGITRPVVISSCHIHRVIRFSLRSMSMRC